MKIDNEKESKEEEMSKNAKVKPTRPKEEEERTKNCQSQQTRETRHKFCHPPPLFYVADSSASSVMKSKHLTLPTPRKDAFWRNKHEEWTALRQSQTP